MAFPYKHVVLIGGTSGIGRAMADRLVKAGSKVTVVGRRQDRLNDFVSTHGESKASSVAFDISNLEEIPEFAAQITQTYPDMDCLFLNAGVQGVYDFSEPEKVDLKAFFSEFNTNFTSIVTLTHAFLPFLQSKKTQTGLIFTGTNLAIVPVPKLLSYCASKTALNVFVLCIRDQLRLSNVKVLEISPPAVQTELHDYMGIEAGRKVGMPLEAFTEEAYKGLAAGNEQTFVGSIGPAEAFHEIVEKRTSLFKYFAKLMRGDS